MITFKHIPLKDFVKKCSPINPTKEMIERFSKEVELFLQKASIQDDEEFQKNEINRFLGRAFGYDCNTRGKVDSAIYIEGEAQVLIEVKALKNKAEFPKDTPLSKALCESILYFLRETQKKQNNSIKHIILCNPYEFYIFDAKSFKIFENDKKIKKLYTNCDDKEGTNTSTEKFYKDLGDYLKDKFEGELPYTHFTLSQSLTPQDLTPIFQLLSPQVLLKSKRTLDANTLNKGFYEELLYILGLEEVSENGKGGGKILIQPSHIPHTLSHSISQAYPHIDQEGIFTLITTWNNRILFLRLLESMLLGFRHLSKPFLDISIIKDFKTLQTLFFEVLAKKQDSRSASLPQEFLSIPYLNSSLFDRITLESEGREIGLLDSHPLPLFARSILKKELKDTHSLPLLEYLFRFLHAYDFTTTPKDIEEGVKKNHDRLINSAVLGLVFEKLNGYKEGSFYTPSFITSYMCKESITQATLEKFNSTYTWQCQSLESLKAQIEKNTQISDEELRSTLLSIRICDPSVGSGHFLVSALNEMIHIAYTLRIFTLPRGCSLEVENDEILIHTREGVFAYTRPSHQDEDEHIIQTRLFNLKKSIIENCLFGVDINPNSCEITKLRLWIELLKYSFYLFDEQGKPTDALETLPNIDINIKCGNSLISNFPLDSNLSIGQTRSFAQNLKTSIQNYKDSVKLYKEGMGEKAKILQDIQSVKSLITSYLAEQNPLNAKLRESLKEFIQIYGDESFDIRSEFGMAMLRLAREKRYRFTPTLTSLEPMAMDARGEKLLEVIQESYEAIESLRSSESFEWRFEFPEVLDEEGNFMGFDCVIGNPPYIRQELIKDLKPTLAKSYEIFKGTSDIYTYFFERGYHLLREGGILSYITSNKWTRAGYGEALRRFILEKSTFKSYIDFNGEKVFESATVDTSITSFLKLSPQEGHQVGYLSCNDGSKLLDSKLDFLPQNSLSSESLTFSSSSVMALKKKIESIGTPLKEWDITINYGIKTGYNEAFIITTEKREEILNNCKTQEEREATEKIIRKMLRGRDIKRYSYEWADLWIIGTFPSLKLNIEDYPSLKSYLSQFRPRIDQSGEKGCRKKTSNQWFETQDSIAYYGEFEREKIVYSEIVREPQFHLDTEHFFAEATSFVLTGKNLKYLIALLNNSFVAFAFKTFYAGGGLGESGYRYKKAFLERLPIPKITESNKPTADKIIALVEEILTAKEQNPSSPTQELESQIDSLVYKLYNLTDEEITIIESKE
ncbi:DUF7149 domain-containing protein [Helicobacter pametensis]|uniref:DUF7149 domain-containing protein n=1 Tax=Helicobacter pametensis TaxID=95149 RepID=UPI0004892418|nr:Eco57I restriction-modification methylase domain-containing protein [Helicobacter pametensis]